MASSVDPDLNPSRSAGRPQDDALETSRLLLELVHVVYATRAAEAEEAAGAEAAVEARSAGAGETSRSVRVVAVHRSGESVPRPRSGVPPDGREAPSTHAIRAAIHVHQHGERTVGQLAEGLGISYGWASRVVHELESGGLVERHVDPSDRRVVHVSLTPEASAMVERTYRWRGEAVQRALAGLSPDQREAVRTFLHSVTEELARTGRERGA